MTQPFIGQIEYFGFTFAPYQWGTAAGQVIPIQQNTTLFSLIGTTYGGNGTTNFALPNLASRQACGPGRGPGVSTRTIGETFGAFNVTLTNNELPQHNHFLPDFFPADASTNVVTPTAGSAIAYPGLGGVNCFAPPGSTQVAMHPTMISPAGSSMPHNNVQPFLGLNVCIALAGVFPSFG
jgi:microcystin-dependent protein